MSKDKISKDALLLSVQEFLVNTLEVPAEELTPQAALGADLGLDSIDFYDMLVHLEKITETDLNQEDFRDVRTYGDLTARIERALAQHVETADDT